MDKDSIWGKSMIIKRSVKQNGNLLPEAYNLLRSLPEESLNNIEHEEFHPVDIYDTSLERILMAFLSLQENLIRLSNLKVNPTKLQIYNVLEPQKELLHAIHAHIDDCYRILKVTSPVQDTERLNSNQRKSAERSVFSWLQLFKHPSYSFFDKETKNYQTSGKIVNKIKHHHARLRLLSYESAEKSFGYYVEGKIIEDKTIKICPDPQIHPECTAFSFSRDMAWNFYTIYIISHQLSQSLTKSIKSYYDLEIIPEINEGGYLDELKQISNYIQNNNLNYFHDEYKTIPHISINESSDDTVLIMKIDSEHSFKDNTKNKTIFIYQMSYSHISRIILPYVGYMQNRYNIEEFKEIPGKIID